MRLFAPAKINLALHVTGRRPDGYHLLDSIVVFAGFGDWLSIAPARTRSLTVTGPRASGVPNDGRNLVWQAADLFNSHQDVAFVLEKHLPHAGGIGSGSADAAAALRGVSELWSRPLPDADALLGLGADIPVCVQGRPARMSGIGEIVEPLPPLPPLWLVLVNPGMEVPTGPVFRALGQVENAPLPALPQAGWPDAVAVTDWLCAARNDLEAPAMALVPEIGPCLDQLNARSGCLLARMSGSGGTCFGLFGVETAAQQAAEVLRRDHPDWWVENAPVLR